MSSVLKRLRETAEMRELKVADRREYRWMKALAEDDGATGRFIKARTPSERDVDVLAEDDPDRQKKAQARERSKAALAELHRGSRLKNVVKALRTFFGGRVD